MKKYLLFVLILSSLWRFGMAQDWCPTVLNLKYIQKSDPARYERILQIEGHLEEYDISHLSPGVYVVHLEHRNGTVVRQLRVE